MLGLVQYPNCQVETNGFRSEYLKPTQTWVHTWESNRIETWMFHRGFGTKVELTPILQDFEIETKPMAKFQVVILTQTKLGF